MLQHEILGLYKSLLRYGQTLKYTDQKYFVHRVRKSFINNKTLMDKSEIDFHYQKGLTLLNRKRVV